MTQPKKKTTRTSSTSTAKVHLTPQDLALTQQYEIDPVEFATWIRVLRQNWRQGTVACKGRSDVAFSNRKPFKQKGTGRARAGSARSPVWRKGGVVFGPMPRTRTLSVSSQLRKRVMNSLLCEFAQAERFVSLPCQFEAPKTAAAATALQQAGLQDARIMVLVTPEDYATHASFANIPTVRLALVDQLNAYDVANVEYIVVLQKDIELCKQALQRWN